MKKEKDEQTDVTLLPWHFKNTTSNWVVHFTSLEHHKHNSNKIKDYVIKHQHNPLLLCIMQNKSLI